MSECSAVSRLQNIFISARLIFSVDEHAIYLPGCKLVHGTWSSAPDILEEFFIKLHLILQHWSFSFSSTLFLVHYLTYAGMDPCPRIISMIFPCAGESSVKCFRHRRYWDFSLHDLIRTRILPSTRENRRKTRTPRFFLQIGIVFDQGTKKDRPCSLSRSL